MGRRLTAHNIPTRTARMIIAPRTAKKMTHQGTLLLSRVTGDSAGMTRMEAYTHTHTATH